MSEVTMSAAALSPYDAMIERYRKARYDDKVTVGLEIVRRVQSGIYEGALREGEEPKRYFVHGAIESNGAFAVVYSPHPTGEERKICLRAFGRHITPIGQRPPRFRLIATE